MSSTNKTTNYELSQFLGTDKPAWLADYNQDMSKIDAQMKLNADSATGADGKADANTTAIGTLANLTTTAKTDLVSAINEVDSDTTTAQNTANTANSTATSALSKANALESALNLTTITSTLSPTLNHGSLSYNNLKSARNSDNSIGKLYGKLKIDLSNTTQTSITVTIPNVFSSLTSGFTLQGLSFRQLTKGSAIQLYDQQSYTINSDGSVSLTVAVFSDTEALDLFFIAGVIFLESFGDQPN